MEIFKKKKKKERKKAQETACKACVQFHLDWAFWSEDGPRVKWSSVVSIIMLIISDSEVSK